MPFLKLDRVYVKNIKVKNAQVLKTKAWKELSDHLPLLVELDWEKQ
jgi:endonuclease/exonuclease/phosphatase family metal-dependent hydrolase